MMVPGEVRFLVPADSPGQLSHFLGDRFFLRLLSPRRFSRVLTQPFASSQSALSLHTFESMETLLAGIRRRLDRMRRRRKVGRAYDMALEIAHVLPPMTDVLDVGCGNGFIAHHLAAILRSRVVGLDVGSGTVAPIDYVPYDGRQFPLRDQSFGAVLLCYVLHHARDARVVLNEVARVLQERGLVIIYEDIPGDWWDRAVCWIHNLEWHRRTGPCTFRLGGDWCAVFKSEGFEVVGERQLSRWRNLFHPVSRRFFVLRPDDAHGIACPRNETSAAVDTEAYLAA